MNATPYPPAPADAGDRIDGLCTWRTILMLGGLLLHSTMGEENRPLYAAINVISASFRMGAFFMISGLLAGFSLRSRSDPGAWLRGRLFRLGVPATFATAVVCPSIWTIFLIGRDDATPPPTIFNLYHLWFLVALLGYTVVAYGLHRIDAERHLFTRLDRRAMRGDDVQPLLLLSLGAASFIMTQMADTMVRAITPEQLMPLVRQSCVAAGLIPLFLLGFAMARAPMLRRHLVARRGLPVAIVMLLGIAQLLWQSGWMPTMPYDRWQWWNALLLCIGMAWCAPAASILILRSALAIRHVPPVIRRLSDASFTIYIAHYPIIVLTKVTAGRLIPWPVVTYLLAVVAGGGLSYLFHVMLVARFPLLSLLFNGHNAYTGRPVEHRPASTAA